MSGSPLLMRMRSQMVTGPPATGVEQVAERLLAIQAQDLTGARLAVRLRSEGVTAADVDAALTERRSVVVSWLNRGTLHLVPALDFWWLRALTLPRLMNANLRRLENQGVTPSDTRRAVAVIEEEVLSGPRTRAELKAALDRFDLPNTGLALMQILFAASLAFPMVRGPLQGGEHCFVDARSWLKDPEQLLDTDEALSRVARRYLAGHGPAGAGDLAKWAGIGLTEARRGLDTAGDRLVSSDGDLYDLADRPGYDAGEVPATRLVGQFDPLLHGWSSNAEILDGHPGVITTNGIYRPFVMVAGRVAGTWRLGKGQVVIRPNRELPSAVRDDLSDEAAAVIAYLGQVPKRGPVEWAA